MDAEFRPARLAVIRLGGGSAETREREQQQRREPTPAAGSFSHRSGLLHSPGQRLMDTPKCNQRGHGEQGYDCSMNVRALSPRYLECEVIDLRRRDPKCTKVSGRKRFEVPNQCAVAVRLNPLADFGAHR